MSDRRSDEVVVTLTREEAAACATGLKMLRASSLEGAFLDHGYGPMHSGNISHSALEKLNAAWRSKLSTALEET